MGAKSIKGSLEFGESIRLRRNELNLTIEEAASKAGLEQKHGAATNLENL